MENSERIKFMEKPFQEILTYPIATRESAGQRKGLIKARDIAYQSGNRVQIDADPGHSSTVVLHKDGDVVTSIEVVCTCGTATLISLEYEPE